MENLAYFAHRTAQRSVALAAALLVAASVASSPAATAAPPPAPAWSATLAAYPTFFAHKSEGSQSGAPGYMFIATNIGAAPTSGEFTIADTLPSGLSFAIGDGGYSLGRHPVSCEASGQTMTCSGGKTILQPGESVKVNIPVAVAPGSFHGVRNEAVVSGGGVVPATAVAETPVGPGYPAFGLLPGEAGLSVSILDSEGSVATQAGSHPYQLIAGMGFPTRSAEGELLAVDGGVKDLTVDLPRGLVVDPGAIADRCTDAELNKGACPDASQVGIFELSVVLVGNPQSAPVPLYAMVPPPGSAVEFGFELIEGTLVHLLGRLRSDGDFGLSADVSDLFAKYPLLGAKVVLWGNPSDESHDYMRGRCINFGGSCPVERDTAAFLTLPGACGAPMTGAARVDSWLQPGTFVERQVQLATVEGCYVLEFDPSIGVRPTTARADSPTGLSLSLHVPQLDGYNDLATAPLRKAEISLPPGLVLNPAGAHGLGACLADQAASGCPVDSKLGRAEVDTPLVDHPLPGAVYLAEPFDNPFGSLLGLYVVIDDPASGVRARLDGRLEADPENGRSHGLRRRSARTPDRRCRA